ncbi:MAG: ABC transporter permease [Verrucomicrobia bacterium]|nr:ABC transporter permease [Verrucomicrobiota bacterium]MBT7067659.1 ABC transporter permease [Verrucomicrobiota bacterium]MBT7701449.1 ABC transporter permease [Verrucomicrobiota bacterium]
MSNVAHKEIKLANQPQLGLGRIFRIAVDGVRYRLFRAAVTVSVIAVAIAFLMNILSESLIKRRLAAGARQELSELRDIHLWAARLTHPSSQEAILADALQEGATIDFVSMLDPADQARFSERAHIAATYLAFFDGLDYDRRRALIHTSRGGAIFDALQDAEGLDAFAARLAEMPAVRFEGTLDVFRAFLDEWPALAAQLNQIIAAHTAAVATLDVARADRTIFTVLAQEGDAFAATVRAAGFQLKPALVSRLREQAQAVLEKQILEGTLSLLESRQFLAQQFDLLPADVSPNDLWHFLEKERHATLYLESIMPLSATLKPFAASRLVELATARREALALERMERLTAGAGGGFLGMGERMGWLLIVSMLVCAIGISNAMLMTVTERFREIATMKCLGALDGFIMLLFVMESCFLGLAGGIVGALLGDLIGFGRMAAVFGVSVFSAVPVSELLSAMGSAIGVGVILAALAAVYPSLKAARLAPMEAMRVE